MAITSKCRGSIRSPHLRKQITIERRRNLEKKKKNASMYRVSQRGNLNYYENCNNCNNNFKY